MDRGHDLALIVTSILLLIGIVGQIILGAVVVIGIALSLRLRLKQMNARSQEFWRSGPDD